MTDFATSKFYTYRGPSEYLDRQAIVFNLCLDPEGRRADLYRDAILEHFPELDASYPDRVVDLFVAVLLRVLKMDIDLYINRYDISRDGDEWVVAVEFLDEEIARDAIELVADWFAALNEGRELDLASELETLQEDFDATLYGGPTIYSLIEAGLKRDIPVMYLYEENQFMWGYGRRQLRGRSTTFHTDGIKDTEFTMYKDMVKDFLLMCGFPTPQGRSCFTVEEALDACAELGFPVVVKPVAGHKGQGVVTNITSSAQVEAAFNEIVVSAREAGVAFDGAIVEQQVEGTDHRLLAVDGQFAAALERVPAYVDGDGRSTIAELIEIENATEARLDNARSPLCKIRVDDDLTDYLALQDRSLSSVPRDGERVLLRRVANISAGGVSINVTDSIHPKNAKMAEDIAKFFNVACLGIDVLARDISQPWTDGDFGIIEINAGPGVFMHLAPAIGGSVDVPGRIIRSHFPEPGSERVPIITGNRLTTELCTALVERVAGIDGSYEVGCLSDDGVFFNGQYFHNNPEHDQNVKVLLRNPRLGFAVIQHTKDDIYDYGTIHQGADVVILDHPEGSEEILARDLLPHGHLIWITDDAVTVQHGGAEVASHAIGDGRDRESVLVEALEPLLEGLIQRYA
jgi:cyanophycin synthetase